jgi:hypothetical protein
MFPRYSSAEPIIWDSFTYAVRSLKASTFFDLDIFIAATILFFKPSKTDICRRDMADEIRSLVNFTIFLHVSIHSGTQFPTSETVNTVLYNSNDH